MFRFSPQFLGTICLAILIDSTLAAATPELSTNVTRFPRTPVVQQDFAVAPPFPILEIGLRHILSQIGANATEAGNRSIAASTHQRIQISTANPAQIKDSAQCGPGSPCADGSCCNTVSPLRVAMARVLMDN